MMTTKEPDWTNRIIDRFERFYIGFYGSEQIVSEDDIESGGWLHKALIEFVKPIAPSVHWASFATSNAKAKFAGGLTGHLVSHYRTLCRPEVWAKFVDSLRIIHEVLIKLGADDIEPIEDEENPFLQAKTRFDFVLSNAFREFARQSVTHQAIFFEGYTKALRRGSVTSNCNGVGQTTRTSAYIWIVLLSPIIRDVCRSVHDVHKILRALLGQSAGDIKRTESICKRIGLRYRSAGCPPRLPSA